MSERKTTGFGVPNDIDPHHFVVDIPAARVLDPRRLPECDGVDMRRLLLPRARQPCEEAGCCPHSGLTERFLHEAEAVRRDRREGEAM